MKPTQEQVIAWARESGALIAPFISLNDITFSPASLQDFAALAYEAGRKDENEACAKWLEEYAFRFNDMRSAALEMAAENLRLREE